MEEEQQTSTVFSEFKKLLEFIVSLLKRLYMVFIRNLTPSELPASNREIAVETETTIMPRDEIGLHKGKHIPGKESIKKTARLNERKPPTKTTLTQAPELPGLVATETAIVPKDEKGKELPGKKSIRKSSRLGLKKLPSGTTQASELADISKELPVGLDTEVMPSDKKSILKGMELPGNQNRRKSARLSLRKLPSNTTLTQASEFAETSRELPLVADTEIVPRDETGLKKGKELPGKTRLRKSARLQLQSRTTLTQAQPIVPREEIALSKEEKSPEKKSTEKDYKLILRKRLPKSGATDISKLLFNTSGEICIGPKTEKPQQSVDLEVPEPGLIQLCRFCEEQGDRATASNQDQLRSIAQKTSEALWRQPVVMLERFGLSEENTTQAPGMQTFNQERNFSLIEESLEMPSRPPPQGNVPGKLASKVKRKQHFQRHPQHKAQYHFL